MSTNVLRTAAGWWVETAAGATRVDTDATTTAELLADRTVLTRTIGSTLPVADLDVLSPVTTPCRVVAQMVNYRSHATDSGIDPDRVPATFFRKASGSVSGPYDDVLTPPHVRLLDYEVEIGLVVGADVPVGAEITAATLERDIAALVIVDDVSARDVQLPKGQFYESKSYPTFTPVGPRLVVLEPGELARLPELRLQTRVNGELRQDMTAADMIVRPVEALRVLTRFQCLAAGDLVLTGTPGGTALSAPPKPIELIGAVLPPHVKWKAFFRRQASNQKYLHDGDVVELTVATPDGALDLGRQRTTVRGA